MIYGFDTEDEAAATAALLVYAIWRSRDMKRFKVSPDVWDQVTRFTKDAAKRAKSLPQFVEALSPRLMCGSIKPRWMEVGIKGEIPMQMTYNAEGKMVGIIKRDASPDAREFLVGVFERANHAAAIKAAFSTTAWVILLVRDRLERERPLENQIEEMEAIDG